MKRQKDKGIFVSGLACKCGKKANGRWCKIKALPEDYTFICNECYEKSIKKEIIKVEIKEHIDLWI